MEQTVEHNEQNKPVVLTHKMLEDTIKDVIEHWGKPKKEIVIVCPLSLADKIQKEIDETTINNYFKQRKSLFRRR